jgi:hypothetical protein
MSDESNQFRSRAYECRLLAAGARHAVSRRELTDIADALDDEARKIDAEELSPRR